MNTQEPENLTGPEGGAEFGWRVVGMLADLDEHNPPLEHLEDLIEYNGALLERFNAELAPFGLVIEEYTDDRGHGQGSYYVCLSDAYVRKMRGEHARDVLASKAWAQ